jgi:hypothetical protein
MAVWAVQERRKRMTQDEKDAVKRALAAMRVQAAHVVETLERSQGTGRFGALEIDALRGFVRTAADLGHTVDDLLAQLEWETGGPR